MPHLPNEVPHLPNEVPHLPNEVLNPPKGVPHLPNEVLNPPKVVPHLPNRLLILQKKVLSLPKMVLWGSKSFRFLQILSAANKQYAGARTPDRQQAAGTAAAFAAAALLPIFR